MLRRVNPSGWLVAVGLILAGFWLGRAPQREDSTGRAPPLSSPSPEVTAPVEVASLFGRGEKSTGLDPQDGAAGKKTNRVTPAVLAARTVSPAVVSVGAERTAYVAEVDPFFQGFLAPYLVYPQRQKIPYLGSGFIIDSAGLVVTNHHVIEGAERIFVTLPDGRELEAKLLDADRFSDVALLKIEATDLPYAEFGDSDDLMIGESVLAIGNPFGNFIQDPHPTVTTGVISAIHRSFNADPDRQRVYMDMIQTDASINRGNSGGPLVNLDAKVVGMNTFIVSPSGGGSIGLGFAIPAKRVKTIVEEIRQHGRLRPLLVDFDAVNLTPRLARALDVQSRGGAVVRSMLPGGPGEAAGLRVGDTITAADGRPIATVDDLFLYMAAQQVGGQIEFEVVRAGKTLKMTYRIQEAEKGKAGKNEGKTP